MLHKDFRIDRREDSDLVSRRHADLESVKYFSSESAREEQGKRRENREEFIARQKGLKIKIKAMRNLKQLGSDRKDSTRRSSLNFAPESTERRGLTFGDLPTSSTAKMPLRGILVKTVSIVICDLSGPFAPATIVSDGPHLPWARNQGDQ